MAQKPDDPVRDYHWFRFFESLATGTFLLVVIDNLHWADYGSVNLLLELAPVACLVPLAFPSLRAVGLAGLAVTAAALAAGLALARWARAPALPALLAPLAAPLIPYALLRAAVLGIRRGGVLWRGTLYPTAQLRQAMRVRL
jgi:hypothetical protein